MSEKRIIKTTCPRDCYDSCGIAVITRDGVVTKVLGDPDHAVSRGALCGKCALAYNGAWRDPEQRLLHPLKRVGDKGEGRFAPISWEAALAEIANRLGAIVADGDPRQILTAHYTGTCSAIANGFPMRFFNRLGATEVEPDTICNNAGHHALGYVYGTSAKGFDPRTARDTACLMVWGCNPHASAPHAYKHWLREQPGKLVVIDPVATPTAAIADLHLQPRPGTDAALAFALLHALDRNGAFDRGFIDAHTVGFAELEPLIAACSPEWGAGMTGVPADQIEQAAEFYGAGPALLWLGQGLQRQPTGGNVMRAAAMLPATTGNIGKPGAGIYYLNGKGQTLGMDMGYVEKPGLRAGRRATISHMDLCEVLEDPARSRALMLWNINIAASNPAQRRLHRALARTDLMTVAVDLFPTDSTDFADYVLPAASFLEFDDLVGSYMHLSVGAQTKVMEPLGEALPNQEIFRRLAGAMGFTEPELFEPDRPIIDHLLASSMIEIDFDELQRRGTVDASAEPLVLFADRQFPTPSGRIEIASDRAAAKGHPRTARPTVEPAPAAGALRLLSPASRWHMNSSYDNDDAIAERAGPATITLHPDDAAARDLASGDRARVHNDQDALELMVAVADIVPPGTALSYKGRWPKSQTGRANVNALNPGVKTDMGESSSVHGVEVWVDKAKPA